MHILLLVLIMASNCALFVYISNGGHLNVGFGVISSMYISADVNDSRQIRKM